MSINPQLILLFSGKRKSGKDYIAERLRKFLGEDVCEIIRISHPIKTHWAKHMSLSLDQLLGDGAYKEKYRKDMIKWGEKMRSKDYGYFCRAACENVSKPICIVSDIRRKTDLQWFNENYGYRIKTIRVNTSDSIRQKRGWIFAEGVDDVASECDLDAVENWDMILWNNNMKKFEDMVEPVVQCVRAFGVINI